jgi:hypothetical protein
VVGREPPAIAAGLADVLVNSLHLDFAFVRLCDPNGGTAVEIARGSAWHAFPEWLQSYLSVNGRLSRREIVRDIDSGAQQCRGIGGRRGNGCGVPFHDAPAIACGADPYCERERVHCERRTARALHDLAHCERAVGAVRDQRPIRHLCRIISG